MILGYEDGFTSGQRWLRFLGVPLGRNSQGCREINLKRRTVTWFAVYVYESLMLLHNSVHGRQS